jgi:type I restriction enzyme S subunit
MALLEQAARLIYDEWFVRLRFPGHEGVRVVDGVPEGWARVAIPDVADTIGGGTPATGVDAFWHEGDIEWVTPSDVTKNPHFVLTTVERAITSAGLAASSAKLLPKHAILMSSRASIGFFAIPGREVTTNQGFISIVCHDPQMWPYLLMHLSSRVEEIRGLGTGTTFLEVSKGKFRNLMVLRPSGSVLAAYAEAVSPVFEQIRKLKQQNEVLVRTRDLLLPRLMSGEVTV